MVCGDAVHDLHRQVVALGDLPADGGVRTFHFVVDGLADVVQQAAHLGDLDVRSDFSGDDGGETARLDGMEQDVLSVAGPVLQPAEQLHDLRRQSGHAGIVGRLFAGLPNDEVDLRARLRDDLLDAAGVDPPVRDELAEGEAGNLAADRIEA